MPDTPVLIGIGATLFNPITAVHRSGLHTGGFSTQGWFVGGGVENNLDIFGISAPGWFMKTEYRAAYYDNKNVNILVDGTNAHYRFRYQLQAAGADGQHLAGLSLQLDRSGEVLIRSRNIPISGKSPGIVRGFFLS